MRILIDLQACQNGSRYRGIGRYTIGIVTSMLEIAKNKHDCHLLLNEMFEDNLSDLISYFSKYVSNKNIHIWNGIGPTEGSNLNNEQRKHISVLLRENFIEKLYPDAVFMPTFFEGFGDNTVLSVPKSRSYKIFATCHDLIPLVQSEIYLDPHPNFKKFYLSQVNEFKNCDGFLAVSESSKQELAKYINIDNNKIINTSEGIEPQFKYSAPKKQKIERILNRKLDNRKVILYFGASDERKNHLKLIKAHSMLSAEAKQQSLLVLAGVGVKDHYNKFKSYAEQCGLSQKEFCIIGRTTDKEVIDLYSYSYLFIFPSFHEGFGLPALEAMACGTAVITADTTSLPEVIGRKDLTFNPYSTIEIKKALEHMILDESFRNQVAQYCTMRAKDFSWAKSASIALNFIEFQTGNILDNKPVLSKPELRKRCLEQIVNKRLTKKLNNNEKEIIAFSLIKNFREERKPWILYDVSKLLSDHSLIDINKVIIELFNQLKKSFSKNFEIIPIKISDDGSHIEEVKNYKLSRNKNKILSANNFMDIRIGDIYINIDLDHSVYNKSQAYDFMRKKGCKTHFIVNDLLPLELGDSFFNKHSALQHYIWLKEVAKADAIICASQAVMHSLDHYLNSIPEVNKNLQLGWFHAGTNITFSAAKSIPKPPERFKNINFNEPVFLMIGDIELKSRHIETIEAITELWDNGFKGYLIISGEKKLNNELAIELINTSQYKQKFLFWPQGVSNEELSYLYSNATALISSSLGEGFCLSLTEAMQHNTDVIARNIPIFREMTHGSSTYFNSTNELKEILLNYKKQPEMNNKFFLSWQESANQLMKLILDGNYPIEWKRNENVRLYPICAEKFNTTAGVFTGDRIRTADKEGLLIWGGYFPIEAGYYDLKIYGKSHKRQKIDLEISMRQNSLNQPVFKATKIPLQRSTSIYDIPEIISVISVEIQDNIDSAEVYLHVLQENDLYITGFEFTQSTTASAMNTVVNANTPYMLYADQFSTTAGIFTDEYIRTTNTQGLLVWGGYFPISSGKYQLNIYGGSSKEQTIDIDVNVHQNKEIHSVFSAANCSISKSTNNFENPIIIKTIEINIHKNLDRAEIYIHVTEENDLYISHFELIPRGILVDDNVLSGSSDIQLPQEKIKKNKSWKKYFHDFWTT